MTRVSLVLLSLLAMLLPAVSSLGQTHDYSLELIRIEVPSWPTGERVPVGETIYYTINWGGGDADAASGLVLEIDTPGAVSQASGSGVTCTNGQRVLCKFAAYAYFGTVGIATRVTTPGIHAMTARLNTSAAPPDPNLGNNSVTHTFEGVALPSLTIMPTVPFSALEPGEESAFTLIVNNFVGTPATNVVVTVALPEGGTIRSGSGRPEGAACTIANDTLTCGIPSLPADGRMILDVAITAPERLTGEDIIVDVVATSTEADFDPRNNHLRLPITLVRQFVVSNVNDEGAGSLRQAMLDVNANCAERRPCAILFRIPAPVPASGWFTIHPHTPLPLLVGSIEIDGDAQTAFTGDTNVDGPEIELDGAMLVEQSGLRLRPTCKAEVHGLAVNRFPGYGIEAQREFTIGGPCGLLEIYTIVRENYLGVDPSGRVAKPNQRGVGVLSGSALIEDNLIGGNLRSGVYLERGLNAQVLHNRIGVGNDGAVLGNGCGIYLGMGDGSGISIYGDVMENVIANNEMSIGRTRVGEVLIQRNSIYDNVMQAIDVDLDGPTPNRDGDGGTDVPNRPVLLSAVYDPVRGATIVRGRIDTDAYATQRYIEVFASKRLSVWSQPQAERSVAMPQIFSMNEDFEIVVPADLRGEWITAAHHAVRYNGLLTTPRTFGSESHQLLYPGNTSELSEALFVH